MVRNSYHLIKNSPWPFLRSMGGLILASGLVGWIHKLNGGVLIVKLGFCIIILIIVVWWRDVIRESWLKKHTVKTQQGLRTGIILFIVSEVLFFFSFFWAYFTRSLCPTVELGCLWPPSGLEIIDPFSIPLCNTAILLWSGLSLTLSHHSLKKSNRGYLALQKRRFSIDSIKKNFLYTSVFYLDCTCLMGLLFFGFQLFEYKHRRFSISDSVYGSVFFVATGFHGLHVLIGTIFLIICALRIWRGHFSATNKKFKDIRLYSKNKYIFSVFNWWGTKHFYELLYKSGGQIVGFEAAIWYWHFVDVVWIFLFLSIYWLGS